MSIDADHDALDNSEEGSSAFEDDGAVETSDEEAVVLRLVPITSCRARILMSTTT